MESFSACIFFFSSRRRHTRLQGDWSSDVCSSDLWLLIKHRDGFAPVEDIATTQPRSVVSRRTLAEIAWHEGGNVEKAARGDPPAEIRRLLANPELVARPKRGKPAVWKSHRP